MTTDGNIEVPGPNDWTMGLSFEGLHVEFRWRELSYQGRSMGHWGMIFDAATGEELHFNNSDERWREQALRDTAATYRVAQLRKELELDQSIPFMTDREVQKSLILDLYDRSGRGEYLGQRGAQQLFYVQDLAAILAMDLGRTLELVDELSEEGKFIRGGSTREDVAPSLEAIEDWLAAADVEEAEATLAAARDAVSSAAAALKEAEAQVERARSLKSMQDRYGTW